jgi:tRNA-dihydrouridine synthase C
MVSDPGLALAIATPGREVPWAELLPLLQDFWRLVGTHVIPRHCAGRLKQWLNYLRRRHPEAEAAYAELRTVNDPLEMGRRLQAMCRQAEPELVL